MQKYCRICGKKIRGQTDICRACEETIRAEATGRQRKDARLMHRRSDMLGVRDRRGIRKNTDQFPAGEEEGETVKKPRHFKSMAEYLEYLKGKK